MRPYGWRMRANDYDGRDEPVAVVVKKRGRDWREWWDGRRIHAWHSRGRWVAYDEVADYIWLH